MIKTVPSKIQGVKSILPFTILSVLEGHWEIEKLKTGINCPFLNSTF